MTDNKADKALKDVKIQLIIKQSQPVGTKRYVPVDITDSVLDSLGRGYQLGYYQRFFPQDIQGVIVDGENTSEQARLFTIEDLNEIKEQIEQLVDVAVVNGAQNKALKQQILSRFSAVSASKNPANALIGM